MPTTRGCPGMVRVASPSLVMMVRHHACRGVGPALGVVAPPAENRLAYVLRGGHQKSLLLGAEVLVEETIGISAHLSRLGRLPNRCEG